MGQYAVNNVSKHLFLNANEIDEVTIPALKVEVLHRGTTGFIYFTVNGQDPVIAGDDTYVVTPGGYGRATVRRPAAGGRPVIKIISDTSLPYSVTAV